MLFKRSNSRYWWCRFTAPDGSRVQVSTKTVEKQQAQEFADTLKVRYWRMQQLGEKPRRTWQEAAVKWYRETNRKSRDNDRRALQWLDQFLGTLYLDEIDRAKIDQIRDAKLKTGVQPATVNRILEVVRVILNTAVKEWEWLDRAPRVKLLKTPNKRIRWLTRNEVARLLTHLPEHLQAMVRFSLATGLRESNVTGLRWSQVDMERRVAWIHGDQSKSGRSIGVPLNREAALLLRDQIGQHQEFCFSYKGKRVLKANTKAWRNALKAAGITDFRWHDLRHTWASWHVQAGTPIHVLQELGGWSEIRMVQRYAHLAPEHLTPYADKICAQEGAATRFTTHLSGTKKAATL